MRHNGDVEQHRNFWNLVAIFVPDMTDTKSELQVRKEEEEVEEKFRRLHMPSEPNFSNGNLKK